ncbi:hypothetical protein HanRHA438_Chr12g0555941 [Helianthus annuus]|nr:hypothetical protein HanRHA438_Chr12g0555941 [Helianthus annuus]
MVMPHFQLIMLSNVYNATCTFYGSRSFLFKIDSRQRGNIKYLFHGLLVIF